MSKENKTNGLFEDISQWLPTKYGYTKIEYLPVDVIDGCVDNSRRRMDEQEDKHGR